MLLEDEVDSDMSETSVGTDAKTMPVLVGSTASERNPPGIASPPPPGTQIHMSSCYTVKHAPSARHLPAILASPGTKRGRNDIR